MATLPPFSRLDCAQSRRIHGISISCFDCCGFHLMQNSHHFAHHCQNLSERAV